MRGKHIGAGGIAEERAAMAGDDGLIRVDCAFCARVFPIALAAAQE